MDKETIKKLMSELGRIGGKARSAKLSLARRKEISSNASKARWARVK